MNRLTLEKRCQIINLLVEGTSLRAASRLTDTAFNSVKSIFLQVGKACLHFHHNHVINVPAQRIQADEVHSFVYSKQKNTAENKKGKGIGDVWIWVAMDADSKLVVSWYAGARTPESACIFMHDLASRLKNRVQLTTDGYKGYLDAVDNAFRLQIDYAQAVKVYENKAGDRTDNNEDKKHYRYKETKVNILSGEPREQFISTSFIERQNLTMRTNIKRLARKTNAFSKKFENHVYALALHYVYYNFVRIHKTLNITPAMHAGLTKRFMNIEDLVRLSESF